MKIPALTRPYTLKVAAVALTIIALAGALTLLLHARSGPPSPAQRASDRAAVRGYTDTVTQPLFSPDQPRPSTPRPDKLPPMIKADGACETALNAVRDFQDANPSGLAMSQPAADELSRLLVPVGPGPSAACAEGLAMNFRHQELEPWQLWQPPVGTVPTPASSVPDTNTATSAPSAAPALPSPEPPGGTPSTPAKSPAKK